MKEEGKESENGFKIEPLPKLQEVEITYISPVRKQKVKICSSRDAYELLLGVIDGRKIDHKEMFFVVLLNRSNLCLGYSMIGLGNMSGVVVNKTEILQLAILSNSSSIILCHNHPSGNLNPSEADKSLTKNMVEVCKMVDINLLDHLIISSTGYLSMADEGYC